VLPQVEWKMNITKYARIKEQTKLLWVFQSASCFTSSALIMRKLEKKQQSQVQTIQRTVRWQKR